MLLAGCATDAQSTRRASQSVDQVARGGSDGPGKEDRLPPRQDGKAASGRDVFRFGTFGNEGFWTDAVRMPAGLKAAKVTPLQALKLGLSVDVDALDSAPSKSNWSPIPAASPQPCSMIRPQPPNSSTPTR